MSESHGDAPLAVLFLNGTVGAGKTSTALAVGDRVVDTTLRPIADVAADAAMELIDRFADL